MEHIDLFAGVGGFALACQWNGIETIGFVEIDKYCQKVLRKHFPNVPIVEDIRDVEAIRKIVNDVSDPSTKGRMAERHCVEVSEQAIRETPAGQPCGTSGIYGNASALPREVQFSRQVLLVTAGFPCQPFSVAGKRGGERDNRYLWPETLTLIKAIEPDWVLLENVAGIINLALDTVLSDLEGAGYATETLIIPACAVNAPHRRDRVWVVAYGNGNREGERYRGNPIGEIPREVCEWRNSEDTQNQIPNADNGSQDVVNTHREGLQGLFNASGEQGPKPRDEQPVGCSGIPNTSQWAVEPELGRVAHGISHRVDRLKCLGNAIVPQVAYEIIKVIKANNVRRT